MGTELTISAHLSTLASAYGSGAVAESDFFKSLQAAIAPASGFEGLQLLYGDTTEPQDTTPPLLTVPETITVDANSPQGAEVSYEAAANDDTDPHPVVSCDIPSGSLFPIGRTTVTCTATDTASNTSEPQHFEVVVNGAAEQLIGLVSLVESFELDKGIRPASAPSCTLPSMPCTTATSPPPAVSSRRSGTTSRPCRARSSPLIRPTS